MFTHTVRKPKLTGEDIQSAACLLDELMPHMTAEFAVQLPEEATATTIQILVDAKAIRVFQMAAYPTDEYWFALAY